MNSLHTALKNVTLSKRFISKAVQILSSAVSPYVTVLLNIIQWVVDCHYFFSISACSRLGLLHCFLPSWGSIVFVVQLGVRWCLIDWCAKVCRLEHQNPRPCIHLKLAEIDATGERALTRGTEQTVKVSTPRAHANHLIYRPSATVADEYMQL